MENNITVVSGYWNINSKYESGIYNEWFSKTLKINQKYIFFGEEKDFENIQKFRGDLETNFVDYPICNFYTKQFYRDHWVHQTHVPSKELGMIWNEKIHLMKLAKDSDENPTEFYLWVDAGVPPYRKKNPPEKKLNLISVDSLPHDKVCYSKVDESYHSYAATVHIMHKNMIDKIHAVFYEYLEKLGNEVNDWRCGSDQFIFTKIRDENPELFYEFTCVPACDNDNGYGLNLVKLFDHC